MTLIVIIRRSPGRTWHDVDDDQIPAPAVLLHGHWGILGLFHHGHG